VETQLDNLGEAKSTEKGPAFAAVPFLFLPLLAFFGDSFFFFEATPFVNGAGVSLGLALTASTVSAKTVAAVIASGCCVMCDVEAGPFSTTEDGSMLTSDEVVPFIGVPGFECLSVEFIGFSGLEWLDVVGLTSMELSSPASSSSFSCEFDSFEWSTPFNNVAFSFSSP
jgi:hypothetical protein